MGSLVFQATLGGQVNLNGPNTASTFDIAVPATTGTMVTTGDTGTVTNTMLAGSIANAKLTNSSVTVGSTSIALGATSTTLDGVNIGATTAGTGAFTTLSASSTVSGTGFSTYLASPPAIGGTTAAAGAFTTLSASSTVSGTGFSTYLASPPAIGGTAAAAGTFTTLSGTTSVTTPIVKSASSLTLQTNGTTTAVTIDTSQNVAFAKGFTVGATAAPTFSAYNNANQSISTSTLTKVRFNAEEWDTNNNFDSTTNYRFTPTVAGYYQCSFAFSTEPSSPVVTRVFGQFWKNGAEYKFANDFNGSTVTGSEPTGSCLIYCNGSTDYVEVYGFIAGGTPVIRGTQSSTWFTAFLARSA